MGYTAKQISHDTGLKPVLTFDQLVAKYESLEPKLPDNPSKASLTLNSMAVQQFIGIATENHDRERDMQLLQERQNMIRAVAASHGFTPHDLHNAMHVLDHDTHDVPEREDYYIGSDEEDYDSDHPPHANQRPKGPPPGGAAQYGPARPNRQTVRPAEFNWMGQQQPTFGRHAHQVHAPLYGGGPGAPPPPAQGLAQPQASAYPRLVEHLMLQGQHLARNQQHLEALGREQLRAAHHLAHKDQQHAAVMQEFKEQLGNMGNELLRRTSELSQREQDMLGRHAQNMADASRRMAEAAEQSTRVAPHLYKDQSRANQLLEQLVQNTSQTAPQTPALDILTGHVQQLTSTVQNLASTVGQGFQNLHAHTSHMAQQAADLTHGYVQEQVTQNDLNTDVILEQQGNIQAQVGNAANELRKQQELLKEKLDRLEVGQQAVAVAQHQQAAGLWGIWLKARKWQT